MAHVNSVVSSITGFSEEELYRGGLKNFMSADALEVLKEMEQGSRGVENKKVCTEMQVTDRSGVVKACEVCIALDAADTTKDSTST